MAQRRLNLEIPRPGPEHSHVDEGWYFGAEGYPASLFFFVRKLVQPEMNIEIQTMALLDCAS